MRPVKKEEGGEKEFIVVGENRFEVTPQGLIFCPGGGEGKKKHPCPDCHFCQWCSDSRCNLCRRDVEGCRKRKGSSD